MNLSKNGILTQDDFNIQTKGKKNLNLVLRDILVGS
jgi:hypothetical protein